MSGRGGGGRGLCSRSPLIVAEALFKSGFGYFLIAPLLYQRILHDIGQVESHFYLQSWLSQFSEAGGSLSPRSPKMTGLSDDDMPGGSNDSAGGGLPCEPCGGGGGRGRGGRGRGRGGHKPPPEEADEAQVKCKICNLTFRVSHLRLTLISILYLFGCE